MVALEGTGCPSCEHLAGWLRHPANRFLWVAITAEDHNHVLQWAHVLEHQVLRLRQSRSEALATHYQVRVRLLHTPADNQPFHRMRGDAHFVMIACVQLFRALNKFNGDLRLPAQLEKSDLRSLRSALQHWDEGGGRAAREMAELGVNPTSHTWSQAEGKGRLGELPNDEDLRHWASQVYDELVDFDPPSPWASGQRL